MVARVQSTQGVPCHMAHVSCGQAWVAGKGTLEQLDLDCSLVQGPLVKGLQLAQGT